MYVDRYSSFSQLRAGESEKAYKTYLQEKPDQDFCIVAIHGGNIEFHTDEIARSIAGDKASLYVFQGLLSSQWAFRRLHITSTRFDDMQCVKTVSATKNVISIHGCWDQDGDDKRIYLGGLDIHLKARCAWHLRAVGFSVDDKPCFFKGEDPRNICNKSS